MLYCFVPQLSSLLSLLIFDTWMMVLVVTIKVKFLPDVNDKTKMNFLNLLQKSRKIIFLESYYSNLQTHFLFRRPIFNKVLLSTLESDNSIRNQLDFIYIYLRSFILVSSSQDSTAV